MTLQDVEKMEQQNDDHHLSLDVLNPATLKNIQEIFVIKAACRMNVASVEFETDDLACAVRMRRLVLVNHDVNLSSPTPLIK